MTPAPAPLDASLRDTLGGRWLRNAQLACVAIAAASLGMAVAGAWPDGWMVGSGAAALVGFVACWRLIGTPHPTGFVVASTVVVAGTGFVVSAEFVPGLAAAALLAGVAAVALFEPRRRVALMVGALIVAVLIVMAVTAGSRFLILGVPIAVSALVTAALIAGVRDHLETHVAAVVHHDLRHRDLFDRVPVGLYRTSLDGVWSDVNQALADLLGFSIDQLVGTPVRSYLADPEDLDRLRGRIPDDGTALATDLELVRADGTVIWVRDRTRAVRDAQGAVVCFEGELQDITQQIEHVERLKELIASKSELIAAVSHELRTPLTAVVGFLDVIGDGGDGEAGEMLRMAAEQANEMATIVDDLLTAARLDNRELVVRAEEVDLVEAVRSAIRSLGDPVTLLSLPMELGARADASRVRQILRNLIGNAYRYGTPPVTVRGEHSGDLVRVIVSDRGAPIPPEVQARMFEAFYTTGRGTRQPGSIGLGLAVSRRLAQRMGGDLRHDRVGGGNRFLLELPAVALPVRVA